MSSGVAACNRGDRTDGTDGSRVRRRHVGRRVYYCELRHLPAFPALRLGVSTSVCELGYRVVDWTWEAQRVRSSIRGA